MARRDVVIWCDPGWYAVPYGFVPSKAAWVRELRRMRVKHPEPYPDSDGRATCFRGDTFGDARILVTIAEHMDGRDPLAVAALIVHEATHVWQFIREAVGEAHPGEETDAYAMQAIFTNLADAYVRTRLGAGRG